MTTRVTVNRTDQGQQTVLILKFLGDIERFIFMEGRWEADPIHLDIIEAVRRHIPADIAAVVDRQLRQPYFFSWMSGGRINAFFFRGGNKLPLVDDPAYSDKLFKVELFIEGKKQTAHVTFYKGRIFSVELKLPRKLYKNKDYRVGAVTEGKARESFTAVIDRAAHGRETETNP